ncbi:AAA family ATPase [Macrococcoides caseolyticum]|uniref:AAA family ATPase n=1 Tax=Macrococcoides caseolyticum TaxID=69966 RepID=UPI0030EEB95D
MNNHNFIETKEYRRFVEFCDACIKYKYIGICYGQPGVGKTLSSKKYCNWDSINYQIGDMRLERNLKRLNNDILHANKIYYTAPAERQLRISSDVQLIGDKIATAQGRYIIEHYNDKGSNFTHGFSGIDLIIIDEIDRLKVQHLEQIRHIYDTYNLAVIFIGMPGIERKLSRYPQLYSRIGFAHEFDNLSKDETHHILEYKWKDLGFDLKLEDFSDYESITTIIKITKGNFRLIHRLFSQIDRIMEINNLNKISVEVVEAARDSLVIGIK